MQQWKQDTVTELAFPLADWSHEPTCTDGPKQDALLFSGGFLLCFTEN